MVKIQIDINNELNAKLNIYKSLNFCKNKQEAINKILNEKLNGIEYNREVKL